ncbi:MAG: T9SS type A sorting domain-containing protein [Candidatus Kapaibacterium sp.]
MKHAFLVFAVTLMTAAAILPLRSQVPQSVTIPNPILFCTQVPVAPAFLNMMDVFGNHRAETDAAPRGGDLYILYPNGVLKNLTSAAGYGGVGLLTNNAIAVRQPCVHWSGQKALFSMVVGAPSGPFDMTKFYWQIYEVTNLGENQTPIITKLPNQPANYNNISPIYGTDGRIIFTSDRPRNGQAHLYPQLDEYETAPTNTGIWSLDLLSGDLRLLDHAPSGAFYPSIDSYGRVIFDRWDHLQRDQEADLDVDALKAAQPMPYGMFNYSDESAAAQVKFNDRTEIFPETRALSKDTIQNMITNVQGFTFNFFTPWQMNEDGTEAETINHLGRHDFQAYINHTYTADYNLKTFNPHFSPNGPRSMMNLREDPTNPGTYYFVDGSEFFCDRSGQVRKFTAAPTLDTRQMVFSPVTHDETYGFINDNAVATAKHTGHYRSPLPMTDGHLVVVHTAESRIERNDSTPANPKIRYDFRLKSMRPYLGLYAADQALTPGISKNVQYWSPNQGVLVKFNGVLWELDPVEVVARPIPATKVAKLPTIEQTVFSEENVNETEFRNYLKSNNLGVIVSRDVTHRNTDDKQQPYFLKVAGTNHQSPTPVGKVYDISYLQVMQADQIRGKGMRTATSTPLPGRRVLAQNMTGVIVPKPYTPSTTPGAVSIGSDGSAASYVPASRAMTWHLTDAAGKSIVRERYWVTFQKGEVRVCASCHGSNENATLPTQITPQNKPEALRTLLRHWRDSVVNVAPFAPSLVYPSNNAGSIAQVPSLRWTSSPAATSYKLEVATDYSFTQMAYNNPTVTDTTQIVMGLSLATEYFWRVTAQNSIGSATSVIYRFITQGALPGVPTLAQPADAATSVSLAPTLQWNLSLSATGYDLQVATTASFAAPVINVTGITSLTKAISGLVNGTHYYWRVRGTNTYGSSAWSSVWSFQTVPVLPPDIPQLTAPVTNATNIATSPTLIWNASYGAGSYGLQVSTVNDFSTTVFNQAGLSLTQKSVSGLNANTQYYWRVNASNSGGTSNWSTVWTFTTSTNGVNNPPATPTLWTPLNNQTNTLLNRYFRCLKSAGAVTYGMQISTSSNFSNLVVNVSGLQDSIKFIYNLTPYTTYYWRMNATNDYGTSSWSQVFNCTTGNTTSDFPPDVPLLKTPVNNQTNTLLNRNFRCAKTIGATTYGLQVSTDQNFTNLVVNVSNLTDTLYFVQNLTPFTTYYWRMNATNSRGTSDWSSVFTCTTGNTPIPPPTLVAEEQPTQMRVSVQPNPIENAAQISFSNVNAERVHMSVKNSLGIEIMTLTDADFSAGDHTISWNTSQISSGLYFIQIKISHELQTIPVIISR